MFDFLSFKYPCTRSLVPQFEDQLEYRSHSHPFVPILQFIPDDGWSSLVVHGIVRYTPYPGHTSVLRPDTALTVSSNYLVLVVLHHGFRSRPFHNAQGCSRQSATPSSSSYVPGRFPDALAVPFIVDPESNHEVQDIRGDLAETIPPQMLVLTTMTFPSTISHLLSSHLPDH